MVKAECDLKSINMLSAELRYPSRRVEQVMVELGYQPALRLNGLAYVDGDQADAIASHLRACEAAKQSNVEAAK